MIYYNWFDDLFFFFDFTVAQLCWTGILLLLLSAYRTAPQTSVESMFWPRRSYAKQTHRHAKQLFFILEPCKLYANLNKLHSVAKWKWSPARFATSFRRAAVLSVQACSSVWRVKRSALRLRLTGSVVQPMSCYDLLTYKAIGSNYLSFVVTSSSSFHNATG